MKYVEVLCLPGGKRSVELADNDTVGQACEKAGFSTNGYTVNVSDDASATLSSPVTDGARIVLTRQVKGAS